MIGIQLEQWIVLLFFFKQVNNQMECELNSLDFVPCARNFCIQYKLKNQTRKTLYNIDESNFSQLFNVDLSFEWIFYSLRWSISSSETVDIPCHVTWNTRIQFQYSHLFNKWRSARSAPILLIKCSRGRKTNEVIEMKIDDIVLIRLAFCMNASIRKARRNRVRREREQTDGYQKKGERKRDED